MSKAGAKNQGGKSGVRSSHQQHSAACSKDHVSSDLSRRSKQALVLQGRETFEAQRACLGSRGTIPPGVASSVQCLVSLRLFEEAGVSLVSTTVQAILPWSPRQGSCPILWARVCVSDASPGANPSPELPVPRTPAKMCSLCITNRHGWALEGPHQRCRHPLLPCAAQADLVLALAENSGGMSHDGGALQSQRDSPRDTRSCGSVCQAATSCQ